MQHLVGASLFLPSGAAPSQLGATDVTDAVEVITCAIGQEQHKGSLEAGKDADIVLFDRNVQARKTFVLGELKYTQGKMQ